MVGLTESLIIMYMHASPSNYYTCTSMYSGIHATLGAIGLNSQIFTDQQAPLLIRDLECSGNEPSLLNCTFNKRLDTSCGQFEEAGIVCQGISQILPSLIHSLSMPFLLYF